MHPTARKIHRRLVPFLLMLYVISYLDRVNLGYASLEMTKDLHFSNAVYGFGAGIFFVGYWLFEIPGTLLVELWSARKTISRIMVTWGLAAACTGLVQTKTQFYWVRFVLGIAEAGFFPGVVVYLTHWCRQEDRARAMAGMMVAVPLSQVLGSPISAALLNIHWLGWSGWRWLLILEGLPAVVVGVWTFFYLTDQPSEAKWLTAEEREWIASRLAEEKQQLAPKVKQSAWRAIGQGSVVMLTVSYFFSTNVAYALALWLPKMVQKMSGYSSVVTSLVSAIPFLVAWPLSLVWGWNSDRTGERRWHTAACMFLAAAGLGLAIATDSVAIGILGMTLAATGVAARLGPFWAMSSSLLSGTAAAVAIGTINSFGNLGGFAGPYIVGFLTDRTGTYAAGTTYLIGTMVVGGVLVLLLRTKRQVI